MIYANTISGPLLYDDINAIVRNAWVHQGDPAAILANPSWWSAGHGHGWRPMTTLTFAANYAAHGLAPAGYHAVNVALHAAVSVLMLSVFATLGVPVVTAVIAALLFAAHPVHTEAVASVVGRAELLTAAAFFLAWRLFLAADRRLVVGGARRTQASLYDALGCVVYFFGLLAKENTLALLPTLAVADILYGRSPSVPSPSAQATQSIAATRRLPLRRYAAVFVVTLVFVACRAAVLAGRSPGIDVLDNPLVALPLGTRLLTTVKVVALYGWRLIFPLSLAADYSFDQITAVRSVVDPLVLAGLAVIVGVPILAWRARRGAPEIALGAVLMMASFALVSNLVVPIGTIMAERLLYLPSAGYSLVLAAALVHGATRLAARAAGRSMVADARALRIAAGLAAVILAGYALRTWTRNVVWTDPLRFFTTMVDDAPRSARSHRELGGILAEQRRFDDARREFDRSLAIKPGDAATLYNLGNVQLQAGRLDDAVESYRAALAAKPDFASAMVNLGNAESMRGDQQSALAWMRKAVDLTPPSELASLRMNIANTLFRTGAREDARAEYRAALALAPDAPDILVNYGAFLYSGGELDEAIDVYARAARRPSPTSLVGLVASYRGKGMTREARAAQARAEALFPNEPSVRQMADVLRHDGEEEGRPQS